MNRLTSSVSAQQQHWSDHAGMLRPPVPKLVNLFYYEEQCIIPQSLAYLL